MSIFGLKAKDTDQDREVAAPPTDSISALAWSPAADFLAASSWSSEVRIYQVDDQGASKGVALYAHDAPVLDVCWSKVRVALSASPLSWRGLTALSSPSRMPGWHKGGLGASLRTPAVPVDAAVQLTLPCSPAAARTTLSSFSTPAAASRCRLAPTTRPSSV